MAPKSEFHLGQRFLNFSVHQHHLESLFKRRSPGRLLDCQVQKICFSNQCRRWLMLLNHTLRR